MKTNKQNKKQNKKYHIYNIMKGGRDVVSQSAQKSFGFTQLDEPTPKTQYLTEIKKPQEIQKNPTTQYLTESKPESNYNIESLVKMYPQNISLVHTDSLYVTPILVGELDLKFTKLSESDFDKIFNLLMIRFKYFQNPITQDNKDEIYSKYLSIIDYPKDNLNLIFSINLFTLMKYNGYEDFYQMSFVPYNKDKNKNKNKKGGGGFFDKTIGTGGRDIVESGINFIGTFFSFEAINFALGMPIDTITIAALTLVTQTVGVRNIMSGIGKGIDISKPLLPNTVRRALTTSQEFVTINSDTIDNYFKDYNTKISGLFSQQLREQYASYSSKCFLDSVSKINSVPFENLKTQIITFQQTEGYLTEAFTQEIVEEEDAPVVPPDFITNDQLLYNFIIVQDGSLVLTEEGKTEISKLNILQRTLIRERIKALYLQNLPDGVTVNKVTIFTMQLNNKLLPATPTPKIEKREYKSVSCPICNKKFRFFPEEGYIHQTMSDDEVDEEIEQLRQQNNDLEITDELRSKVKKEVGFYTKVNIFPCKQLIQVLTPEQKVNLEFTFNSEYGEDNNGSKLICSNCCLDSLNSLDDSIQKLYVGAQADNIIFSPQDIFSLIADLSPKELEEIYSKNYNEHRLSNTKFGQFKQNNDILTSQISKIKTDLFNVTIAKNPVSIEIIDAEVLDEKYKKYETECKIDKIAIKDDFKLDGEIPAGVKIVQNLSLRIK